MASVREMWVGIRGRGSIESRGGSRRETDTKNSIFFRPQRQLFGHIAVAGRLRSLRRYFFGMNKKMMLSRKGFRIRNQRLRFLI